MKWIALGSGKQPDYGREVFLCRTFDGGMEVKVGVLESVTETSQGRLHFFDVGDVNGAGENSTTSRFTHFAIPELPKK